MSTTDPRVDVLIERMLVALTSLMDIKVIEMTPVVAFPIVSIITKEGEV